MVKHTQTIRRLLPTNCLSVFDHFVGLAPMKVQSFHYQKLFHDLFVWNRSKDHNSLAFCECDVLRKCVNLCVPRMHHFYHLLPIKQLHSTLQLFLSWFEIKVSYMANLKAKLECSSCGNDCIVLYCIHSLFSVKKQ